MTEHNVRFLASVDRSWPGWRADGQISRWWSEPGGPDRGHIRAVRLGWYWRRDDAAARAKGWKLFAERISRMAGHTVHWPGGDVGTGGHYYFDSNAAAAPGGAD